MRFSFELVRARLPKGHLHVHPIAAWRRLLIALLAVAVSAFAFRGYVSAGLVNRGDDLLRAGESGHAVRYYERAMFFDPQWETPVDRLGFAASMSGNADALRAGVAITSRYLAINPDSELVRWDRAMCYLHLNRRLEGYEDMKLLAHLSARQHDQNARKYADISYNLAVRLGRPAEARDFAALRDIR